MAQQDRFAELLSRVARQVTRRQNSEVCCGELTLEQFQTLQAIDRADRTSLRTSVGSLSAELQVDLSTMSRNLTVLERGGYLVRARSDEDSRVVQISLVAKGRRALETLRCSERDVLRDVYDGIPSGERPGVLRTLEVLSDCLAEPDDGDSTCCPPATGKTSA